MVSSATRALVTSGDFASQVMLISDPDAATDSPSFVDVPVRVRLASAGEALDLIWLKLW